MRVTTAAGLGDSAASAASVPRPLHERIGLRVSTFSVDGTAQRIVQGEVTHRGRVEEHGIDYVARRQDLAGRQKSAQANSNRS